MNIGTFTETLQQMLAGELGFWQHRLSTETMRAFDLGCFPWHGYLELSFLTTNEPGLNPQHGKFDNIASWRWYNFTATFTSGWPRAIEIARWMQGQWSAATDKAVVSKSFLTAAASVAQSSPVLTALAMYRRSEDFEVTVFDPDHPARGNLVRNGRGRALLASGQTTHPTR